MPTNLNTKEGRVIEKYITNIQEKLGRKKFEESVRRKHNQAQSEYIIRENKKTLDFLFKGEKHPL